MAYFPLFFVCLFVLTAFLGHRQASSKSNDSDNIDPLPPTIIKLEESS